MAKEVRKPVSKPKQKVIGTRPNDRSGKKSK